MSRLVALAEVAIIAAGGRLKVTGVDFVEQGVPAFGAGGLNGYVGVAEYHGPGILLSSVGARCGKCFLVDGAWTSLANTQIILPDLGSVDPRYLWYQLNDEQRWPRSGTAQPFIKPSDVRRHLILLPRLDEQRRIAGVLDRADALRTKRRETLARLDELTQSAFGATLERTNSTALVAVGEIAEVRTGPFGSLLHKHDYIEGGIPLVNPMHIINGRIRPASTVSISAKKFATLGSYELRAGDVVMGRRGEIGRCAEVRGDEGVLLCGTGSMVIRAQPDRALPAYLAALLRSRAVVDRLTRLAKGTTMLNLNATMLARLEVSLPPLDTQERFARADAAIGKVGTQQAAHLDHLDSLFASLRQRAFRGDLFSSPLPPELADAVA